MVPGTNQYQTLRLKLLAQRNNRNFDRVANSHRHPSIMHQTSLPLHIFHLHGVETKFDNVYLQIVCLRSRCEHALKHHLDENTVFYLLSLADQLSAKILKVKTSLVNKSKP